MLPLPRRLIVSLVLVLLTASLAAQDRKSAGQTFKPFRYKSIEGAQTALPDLLGKLTLVVFFYPTCQYCNVALPEIQKLYDTYREQGLATVWINVVPEQNGQLAQWRSRHNYSAPILLGGRAAQNTYSVAMTPTHYLLDGDGRVLVRQEGFKAGDEKELERQIRDALVPKL